MNNDFTRNQYGTQQGITNSVHIVLTKTFLFMLGVLLLSAAAASWTIMSGFYFTVFSNRIVFYGLLIGEIAIVIFANGTIAKNKTVISAVLLVLYSIVNGITLSSIFLIYDFSSIANIFLLAAAVFGCMAVFGLVTKKDLTSLGTIGIMGIFAVIILSVVNIFFLKSNSFSLMLSAIGLALFIGLTAYDLQKIKQLAASRSNLSTTTLAMYGALILYLDFVNIFLKLLRLFGRRN